MTAAKILGFKWIKQFDYPDNQMDGVNLLSIVKNIEINYVIGIKPT